MIGLDSRMLAVELLYDPKGLRLPACLLSITVGDSIPWRQRRKAVSKWCKHSIADPGQRRSLGHCQGGLRGHTLEALKDRLPFSQVLALCQCSPVLPIPPARARQQRIRRCSCHKKACNFCTCCYTLRIANLASLLMATAS